MAYQMAQSKYVNLLGSYNGKADSHLFQNLIKKYVVFFASKMIQFNLVQIEHKMI